MRVPLNHPFIDGFSLINHPFLGIPIYGKPMKTPYYGKLIPTEHS